MESQGVIDICNKSKLFVAIYQIHGKHVLQNGGKRRVKETCLHYIIVDLGVVDIMENITPGQREQIRIELLKSGLELMDDKKAKGLTPLITNNTY